MDRFAVRVAHRVLSATPPASSDSSAQRQGRGVPAGSGYTGFFFGSMESKHTKTFFPLFSVGTYLSPTP